ncbi:conserved hypothetical protein [Rubrivivax sp. A210]|uniref:hypothetical protein n=1 Tax=Rubrivivax sp. A210 TaxID=2772301 RepID=UPI00191B5FC0|nr:hypothetical protein [Rubrivivax sp. A210]CAD5374035.1 conserved hypothetical protein [Rubrivivax sp. A210]
MDNKSIFDIISFVASIASLILAVGAIWLSVVFYRMSNEAAKATTEAAKDIAASVERLEKLFDKLYSDTFSMMRDTVSDMRKHIWPTEAPEQENAIEEAEKKADEKISELKKVVENQVAELLQRQRIADDKMASLTGEMRGILDRAIVTSRQVDLEAREETVREHILRQLRVYRRSRPKATVNDLVERLQSSFPLTRIITEVERLQSEKIIELVPDELAPGSLIRLIAPTATAG